MKSTIDGHEPGPYPCLKIGKVTGRVVLFSAPKTGTVVHEGHTPGRWGLGDYSESWVEKYFSPFTGTLTLEN